VRTRAGLALVQADFAPRWLESVVTTPPDAVAVTVLLGVPAKPSIPERLNEFAAKLAGLVAELDGARWGSIRLEFSARSGLRGRENLRAILVKLTEIEVGRIQLADQPIRHSLTEHAFRISRGTTVMEAPERMPYYPFSGKYIFDMHGATLGIGLHGQQILARDLAEYITADPNWNGRPVLLLICGSSEQGLVYIALELSTLLRVPVDCAPHDVFACKHGVEIEAGAPGGKSSLGARQWLRAYPDEPLPVGLTYSEFEYGVYREFFRRYRPVSFAHWQVSRRDQLLPEWKFLTPLEPGTQGAIQAMDDVKLPALDRRYGRWVSNFPRPVPLALRWQYQQGVPGVSRFLVVIPAVGPGPLTADQFIGLKRQVRGEHLPGTRSVLLQDSREEAVARAVEAGGVVVEVEVPSDSVVVLPGRQVLPTGSFVTARARRVSEVRRSSWGKMFWRPADTELNQSLAYFYFAEFTDPVIPRFPWKFPEWMPSPVAKGANCESFPASPGDFTQAEEAELLKAIDGVTFVILQTKAGVWVRRLDEPLPSAAYRQLALDYFTDTAVPTVLVGVPDPDWADASPPLPLTLGYTGATVQVRLLNSAARRGQFQALAAAFYQMGDREKLLVGAERMVKERLEAIRRVSVLPLRLEGSVFGLGFKDDEELPSREQPSKSPRVSQGPAEPDFEKSLQLESWNLDQASLTIVSAPGAGVYQVWRAVRAILGLLGFQNPFWDMEVWLSGPIDHALARRLFVEQLGVSIQVGNVAGSVPTWDPASAAELAGWSFPAEQVRYWPSPALGVEVTQLRRSGLELSAVGLGSSGLVLDHTRWGWWLRPALEGSTLTDGHVAAITPAEVFEVRARDPHSPIPVLLVQWGPSPAAEVFDLYGKILSVVTGSLPRPDAEWTVEAPDSEEGRRLVKLLRPPVWTPLGTAAARVSGAAQAVGPGTVPASASASAVPELEDLAGWRAGWLAELWSAIEAAGKGNQLQVVELGSQFRIRRDSEIGLPEGAGDAPVEFASGVVARVAAGVSLPVLAEVWRRLPVEVGNRIVLDLTEVGEDEVVREFAGTYQLTAALKNSVSKNWEVPESLVLMVPREPLFDEVARLFLDSRAGQHRPLQTHWSSSLVELENSPGGDHASLWGVGTHSGSVLYQPGAYVSDFVSGYGRSPGPFSDRYARRARVEGPVLEIVQLSARLEVRAIEKFIDKARKMWPGARDWRLVFDLVDESGAGVDPAAVAEIERMSRERLGGAVEVVFADQVGAGERERYLAEVTARIGGLNGSMPAGPGLFSRWVKDFLVVGEVSDLALVLAGLPLEAGNFRVVVGAGVSLVELVKVLPVLSGQFSAVVDLLVPVSPALAKELAGVVGARVRMPVVTADSGRQLDVAEGGPDEGDVVVSQVEFVPGVARPVWYANSGRVRLGEYFLPAAREVSGNPWLWEVVFEPGLPLGVRLRMEGAFGRDYSAAERELEMPEAVPAVRVGEAGMVITEDVVVALREMRADIAARWPVFARRLNVAKLVLAGREDPEVTALAGVNGLLELPAPVSVTLPPEWVLTELDREESAAGPVPRTWALTSSLVAVSAPLPEPALFLDEEDAANEVWLVAGAGVDPELLAVGVGVLRSRLGAGARVVVESLAGWGLVQARRFADATGASLRFENVVELPGASEGFGEGILPGYELPAGQVLVQPSRPDGTRPRIQLTEKGSYVPLVPLRVGGWLRLVTRSGLALVPEELPPAVLDGLLELPPDHSSVTVALGDPVRELIADESYKNLVMDLAEHACIRAKRQVRILVCALVPERDREDLRSWLSDKEDNIRYRYRLLVENYPASLVFAGRIVTSRRGLELIDEKLPWTAGTVRSADGYYSVQAHGSRAGIEFAGQVVSGDELAELIRRDRYWNGRPVRLIVSNLSGGLTADARRLAEVLGVRVEFAEGITVTTLRHRAVVTGPLNDQGELADLKTPDVTPVWGSWWKFEPGADQPELVGSGLPRPWAEPPLSLKGPGAKGPGAAEAREGLDVLDFSSPSLFIGERRPEFEGPVRRRTVR
jgi:hypothetical protein